MAHLLRRTVAELHFVVAIVVFTIVGRGLDDRRERRSIASQPVSPSSAASASSDSWRALARAVRRTPWPRNAAASARNAAPPISTLKCGASSPTARGIGRHPGKIRAGDFARAAERRSPSPSFVKRDELAFDLRIFHAREPARRRCGACALISAPGVGSDKNCANCPARPKSAKLGRAPNRYARPPSKRSSRPSSV